LLAAQGFRLVAEIQFAGLQLWETAVDAIALL
jgi:hypothetical protein